MDEWDTRRVLHCPATIVVAHPEDDGAYATLVSGLRDRRVALVYSGADVTAGGLAARLASDLDTELAELAELTALDPTTMSRFELADRLQSVADLHRGETVLVVADQAPPDAAPVEVEIGDDGVRLVHRD